MGVRGGLIELHIDDYNILGTIISTIIDSPMVCTSGHLAQGVVTEIVFE